MLHYADEKFQCSADSGVEGSDSSGCPDNLCLFYTLLRGLFAASTDLYMLIYCVKCKCYSAESERQMCCLPVYCNDSVLRMCCA